MNTIDAFRAPKIIQLFRPDVTAYFSNRVPGSASGLMVAHCGYDIVKNTYQGKTSWYVVRCVRESARYFRVTSVTDAFVDYCCLVESESAARQLIARSLCRLQGRAYWDDKPQVVDTNKGIVG